MRVVPDIARYFLLDVVAIFAQTVLEKLPQIQDALVDQQTKLAAAGVLPEDIGIVLPG